MHKKKPFARFLIRWFVNSLGLWIAAGLLAGGISYDNRLPVVIVAGLILSVLNVVIKPVLVVLSLPAILFSLGLFMIIINGLMILLVSWLYEPLDVQHFGAAVLAGMVIGLVNYLVTTILEDDE